MSVKTGVNVPRDVSRLFSQKGNKKGLRDRFTRNHAMQEAMRAVAEIDDGDPAGALVIIEILSDQLQAENKKAPQWRHLSKANTLFMLHVGLKHLADQQPDLRMVAVPFTFNLTPALVEKASKSSDRSFSGYILNQLTTALKRKLGRDVELFFVVEIANPGPTGRPHLHGEILLTGREAEHEVKNVNHPERRPVHQAFHEVNGQYDNEDFKNRAIRFEMDCCNLGWPDYTGKCLSVSGMYYEGRAIAKTHGCTRSARTLHEAVLLGRSISGIG